jgi:hypothetical protein
MKVTTIDVSAARTFNHPHEQYSNLRPEVRMVATLEEGEEPASAVKLLQAMAEGLVEDHKQSMLKSLEDLHQLSERAQEVRGLQKELEKAQARLDAIRKQHPDLVAQIGPGQEPEA